MKRLHRLLDLYFLGLKLSFLRKVLFKLTLTSRATIKLEKIKY